MACPALPTCGLAVTEAERALPGLLDQLEVELARLGLADERFTVRMTGCPNGCARPYNSDIGLVGRSAHISQDGTPGPGTYTIFLGGRTIGDRLNIEYKDYVPYDRVVAELVPVFSRFKAERDRRRVVRRLLRPGRRRRAGPVRRRRAQPGGLDLRSPMRRTARHGDRSDRLDPSWLIAAAREAAAHAYCPYSRFRVGAAVLTARRDLRGLQRRERVVRPDDLRRAERGLSGGGQGEGPLVIRAVVVFTPTPEPTAPCGACRQVINEFGPDAEVLSVCDGPAK